MGKAKSYLAEFSRFSPSVNLYLLSSVLVGLATTIVNLFLNFYLQGLNLNQADIGLLNALPSMGVILAGVPIGLFARKRGAWAALMLGSGVASVAMVGTALVSDRIPLMLFALLYGVGQAGLQGASGAFMAERVAPEQRDAVFSLQFAVSTMTGFVGNMVVGHLPQLFGGGLGVSSDNVAALRLTMLVIPALIALSIGLLFFARGGRREEAAVAPVVETEVRRGRLAGTISQPGVWLRLLLPNTFVSLGAGLVMPFLNLYITGKFGISFDTLGAFFAWGALGTTVATLLQPLLARRVGAVRSVIFVQVASLPFLLLLGYAMWFPLVATAFYVRGALMNMGNPIYSSYAMGKMPPRERSLYSSVAQMNWSLSWFCGSLFSGWLRQTLGFTLGWNILFAMMAALYASSFLLLYFLLDRPERQVQVLSFEF